MGHSLDVMVAMRSPKYADQLKSKLNNVNGYSFDTFTGGLSEAVARIAGDSRKDVVVVDLELKEATELDELAKLIERCGPGTPIVATAHDASLDDVRKLMRIGVADYLPQPIESDDLLSALDTLASRIRATAANTRGEGLVYSFLGACGGMGSTTLAIQAACNLLGRKKPTARVCLLDVDLQFGNVGLSLDISSKRSLLDILQSVDRFDPGILQGVITEHACGIDVVPAPPEIVPLEFMSPELAGRLVEVARAEYQYVVFDMPQAWTNWTAIILEKSDFVVLVTQMTVPAIRLARRQLDTLRQHGVPKDRVMVVANRFDKQRGGGVQVKQAEKALDHEIGQIVANEFKVVNSAQNQGVPIRNIQRNSKVAKQIAELVQSSLQIIDPSAAVEETAESGLMRGKVFGQIGGLMGSAFRSSNKAKPREEPHLAAADAESEQERT